MGANIACVDVKITPQAVKRLKPLPTNVKKQVRLALQKLEHWPDVEQVVKLQGSRNGYRIRAGEYRVFFDMVDGSLLVTDVRPRGGAYKD